MTYAEIGDLTFPQIRCLQHEGKVPSGVRRTFRSMDEAIAHDRRNREE